MLETSSHNWVYFTDSDTNSCKGEADAKHFRNDSYPGGANLPGYCLTGIRRWSLTASPVTDRVDVDQAREGVDEANEDEAPVGRANHAEDATDDKGYGDAGETNKYLNSIQTTRAASVIFGVHTARQCQGQNHEDCSKDESQSYPEQRVMLHCVGWVCRHSTLLFLGIVMGS